ncbi:MAG: hypothetical protein ABW194_04410 [Novosphingobium sp.]
MRAAVVVFTLAIALAAPPAAATSALVGHYRLAEGPDVAGELVIAPDGRFGYVLAAGALDERAQGTWRAEGERVCLTTEPKPVPPAFRKLAPAAAASDAKEAPTILVTWPGGRGVAGVNFTLGFASGDPIEDYTQEYGWTLPEGEARAPHWVELREPIHGIISPRYELTREDGPFVRAEIVPNDIGVVDFAGACFEKAAKAFVLHRREGDMRFVRVQE